MDTNVLPMYGTTDNATGCCPRFNPDGWDEVTLHLEDKPFVVAQTRGLFHIPLNIGSVFPKTFQTIKEADALDESQVLVLSRDPSAWRGEHLFAVTKDVPGQKMKRMTGDFLLKVFEGPYSRASRWLREMESFVSSKGKKPLQSYLFYTTCPKCAKAYGKNYVVAVTQVQNGDSPKEDR